MFWTRSVRSNKGQIDFCFLSAGEFDLCAFRGFLQSLERQTVFRQINSFVFVELLDQPSYNFLIKIFSSQVRVAARCLYLNRIFRHIKNGNVKGASPKIIHHDFLILLFVQSISQGRGSGLVDYPFDLEPRNFARHFGCFSLAVVKIRRHGDDGFGDFFTKLAFCVLLQFAQYHG